MQCNCMPNDAEWSERLVLVHTTIHVWDVKLIAGDADQVVACLETAVQDCTCALVFTRGRLKRGRDCNQPLASFTFFRAESLSSP